MKKSYKSTVIIQLILLRERKKNPVFRDSLIKISQLRNYNIHYFWNINITSTYTFTLFLQPKRYWYIYIISTS